MSVGGGADKAGAPVLIVPVGEDACVVAIHRTFLRPEGKGKAAIAKPRDCWVTLAAEPCGGVAFPSMASCGVPKGWRMPPAS
ncbi:DUF7146 domain-containing protein [Sphingobium sp. EP60837]|uniref:DUF7146 domain-containing protein n=1 Tax=Sphingobium sp. EP60837 TaxID=1855519 RepID=UPI003FA7E456